MRLFNEEAPTPELRWNTYNARTAPRLEQKWHCREGETMWSEWRPVPSVEDEPGTREPRSNVVYD